MQNDLKKKLLIHQVFNSSLVSGPETLVIPNLCGFRHEVVIVLLQETRLPQGSQKVADYARSMGFEVCEILVHGRLDFTAVKQLSRYIEKNSPDIVHAHGPKASLHVLLSQKLPGKRSVKSPKLITTHHGVRANDLQLKLKLFETIYEKTTIPFFDRCLTVATSDRDLLVDRGINEKILRVHLNGVDRELILFHDRPAVHDQVRNSWAQSLGLNSTSGFWVGVVGRLAIEKQYDKILQAMKGIFEKNKDLDARLFCFGSGPLESQLKGLTKDLNIETRVHWMGYRNNISREMAGLDLLLSLSTAEGLPINLIEAAWSGTPVLAQGVDGILDLINSNTDGILLKNPATIDQVANTLVHMGQNREETQKLALNLQKRVQDKFSKKSWVTRLEEIYEEALK